jgi:DNA-binding NarL/FixJ family response regulator
VKLLGRGRECQVLDRLLIDALAGESGAVILRGEAGVGKTALLTYVTERAQGWRVVRAVGVEPEMELAYSGLHQLAGPLLDQLDRLPVPQRDALARVFGLTTGPPPDRFLVGLAALTLLAEAAERQPLLCIVEDAHWLDEASAQVIAFVARRLLAERIAVVCTARTGIGDRVLTGLPELAVDGLGESDARALLLRNVHAPIDVAVCDQIVAESHGNPLALLELPHTWAEGALAGGFAVPDNRPVSGKIEHSYVQRIAALAPATRLLVLAAAAEPLGDPLLLHRVAATLDVDIGALDPAVKAGLLKIGARVHFAHPLVRSAAYRSAPAGERHRVHHALALATDPETDPDRRAWHRARAAPGLDEDSALELERSAGRAQARGGLAAAALFLQWSVMLTGDPLRRAERALAAARANLEAGRYDVTRDLLTTAQAGPLDAFQQARVDILRGQVALFSALSSEATTSLLEAARRLETLDVRLARETYLDAWFAGLIAGRPTSGPGLLDVSAAARSAPAAEPLRPADLLLDGLATLTTEGPRAAAPLLERTTAAFTDEACPEEAILRWNWLAVMAAWTLWDDDSVLRLCERALDVSRRTGTFAHLHIELGVFAVAAMRCGDFGDASRAILEVQEATTAIGTIVGSVLPMLLAACQGRETEARALIRSVTDDASAAGQGTVIERCHFAKAVLCNGLGQHAEAMVAAQHATDHLPRMYTSPWAALELLEAATRAGEPARARLALDRVLEATDHLPNDAAQGIAARARALLAESGEAERHHQDAIERLGRSRLRPELARAHLLFGEWLRREGRRADAREHLRRAHEQFRAIGMEAFAERARIELVATGERVSKRRDGTRADLTAQELQIARLARDGLTNPEIGAQLFLSARTVEWHLSKVFTKLEIGSRRQLRAAFPEP